MREKQDIMSSAHLNILNSDTPNDTALTHSFHTLEVLIDIRDILEKYRERRESFLKHIAGTD